MTSTERPELDWFDRLDRGRADRPGRQRGGERTDEDERDEDEDQHPGGADRKQLFRGDPDSGLPDEKRERQGRERNEDGHRTEDGEADLLPRPPRAPAELVDGLPTHEGERTLAEEGSIESVDEDVVSIELEDRKKVQNELEDQEA